MDECPRLRVEVSQPLVTEKLRRLAGNLDQGRHFHPHAVPEPLQVPGDRRPEQSLASRTIVLLTTPARPRLNQSGRSRVALCCNTSETYEKYEFT